MKIVHAFSRTSAFFVLFILIQQSLFSAVVAQKLQELKTGWICKPISEVTLDGKEITGKSDMDKNGWLPAVVPGTVLTTLLENGKIPNPFYGMNNEEIPDIHDTGRDHYTYWFYNEFELNATKGNEFWLILRGVNYSCEIFLNRKKVNPSTHYGMFLRQKYNITSGIIDGMNKLAVLVYPPDPVGNPNGGQGGDGTIAKNVMHQYVAGWDWIQPVRDRNTGIWDKVFIERTGPVDIRNPHIITLVPGQRYPGNKQDPARLLISSELINTGKKSIRGELIYLIENQRKTTKISLRPHAMTKTEQVEILIENPKLWWPNGYGDQALYDLDIQFKSKGKISDSETVRLGIREIQTEWNAHTQSRQVYVNGQKIFIKGGNWIISDAMLRFSDMRYDAEVRMHRDMNLNTIRIWGGAITERPEFYEACDTYGMLVMQDFWISGDCNGRWLDPRKKEDQWTRRKYPDNPRLFLRSASDQIKMIRNHPSLAFWCGGNELPPAEDLLNPLKDTLSHLDGTRWFAEYSTSDSLSLNTFGGNGDGPYGIQDLSTFFEHRTFPFNSEIGSVGLPDFEGLSRYLPDSAMVIPKRLPPKESSGNWHRIDLHPAWRYHRFIPYDDFIEKYGEPANVKDYAFQAQLVNYNQYRGLIEGFSSHMWDWYTGVMIWKTQNPWTSMRGQMYDCYLDQNAGLYGLRNGSKSLHVFFDHTANQVMIANNTFVQHNDLMIQVHAYDMSGNKTTLYQEVVTILPTISKRYGTIGRKLDALKKEAGIFLEMKLFNNKQELVDENFYWLPNETGHFSGLQNMSDAQLNITATRIGDNLLEVGLENTSDINPVSFFNRISVVDKKTERRVLPVFYSDNYISVPPATSKFITIDLSSLESTSDLKVRVQGWNTETVDVEIAGL